MPDISLTQIRDAAQQLANAHLVVTTLAKSQEEAIAAALAPIVDRYRPDLDGAAAAEAEAAEALMRLLKAAPGLFTRKRSLTVDTVRAGYRKGEDTLDWADDQDLIQRIEALYPELLPVLVRTQESLVVDAVAQLEPEQQRRLGIRRVSGADNPFVTFGDSDVDRLVKAIMADAAKRAGEAEAPRTRKGKVKAKA